MTPESLVSSTRQWLEESEQLPLEVSRLSDVVFPIISIIFGCFLVGPSGRPWKSCWPRPKASGQRPWSIRGGFRA